MQFAVSQAGLLAACRAGNLVAARRCIRCFDDVAQTDEGGWTSLLHATIAGNSALVELLLKSRADIGQAAKFGLFPLYAASQYGHVDLVWLLLECGADIAQTNNHIHAVRRMLGSSLRYRAAAARPRRQRRPALGEDSPQREADKAGACDDWLSWRTPTRPHQRPSSPCSRRASALTPQAKRFARLVSAQDSTHTP